MCLLVIPTSQATVDEECFCGCLNYNLARSCLIVCERSGRCLAPWEFTIGGKDGGITSSILGIVPV